MAKNRSIATLLPLSAVLVLGYLTVVPEAAPPEYEVTREWLTRLDVENVSGEWGRSSPVVPFRVGNVLGYIEPSGELVHIENVRHDVAMSPERYANFGPIVQNLVLQDPSGQIASSLGPSGYPVFINGSLFTIDGVGNTLSRWDPTLGKQWTRTFSSLITALAAEDGLIAAGLLSGEIVFVEDSGEWGGRLRPGQSRIEAIYGLSLHAGLLGVVSGQSPQRLTVYQSGDTDWVPFFEHELTGGLVRQVWVDASPTAVFYQSETGVGAALAPDWVPQELPVDGRLAAAATDIDGAMATFVSRTESGYSLTVVDESGRSIFSSPFDAADVWLTSNGGGILLGRDDSILRLSLGLN